MVKLTSQQSSARETLIRVEGRLDAESLQDLRALLAPHRTLQAVRIDLAGLTSMDTHARDFLVGLRAAGCRLHGGSLYINRLMEEA